MLPLIIFFVIVLLVDLYAYKGFKMLWRKLEAARLRIFLSVVYWLIPVIFLTLIILSLYFRDVERDPKIFNGYLYIVAYGVLFYFPKLVFILFHLIEDLVFGIRKLYGNLIYRNQLTLISRIGLIVSIIPFLAVLYGVYAGRFDFRVINHSIYHPGLPTSFDGFRIVHISDIHIGSFYGHSGQVEKAVEIINSQTPDLIVFTGDLVNNFTSELDGFKNILAQMDAKHGVYSILGNHDYGDYFQWESEEAKEENMKQMISAQQEIGFKLLLNEWDSIVIDGEKIILIGVENWGSPPFPQYGDLEKASEGTEDYPFRILLTHDPSHWEEVVRNNDDIELALSGHTHGFQFGLEVGNFSWSPSQYIYERWGGLYQEDDQFINVNRGLGYLGFPGRIGMPPEITVIELRKAQIPASVTH